MNGTEMMLKSLGLGPALDGVKQLIEAGTLDKIVKFADGMDELLARFKKVEAGIEGLLELELRGGTFDPYSDLKKHLIAAGFRAAEVEPGSSSGTSSADDDAGRDEHVPVPTGTAGGY